LEKQSPFRLTLWPEATLPLTGERPVSAYEIDGQTLTPVGWPQHAYHPWQPTRLAETYLELCTVELDDPEAILEFVNAHGVLSVRHEDFRSVPATIAPRSELDELAAVRAVIGEELAGRIFAAGVVPLVETLAEFRFGAMAIRRMETAWRAYQDPEDERSRHEAARFLERWLGSALWAFPPTVALEYLADDSPRTGRWGSVPLYSICCLQLFNHMTQGNVARPCANETCTKIFVHQEGRAEYRQHRTRGVKFHSASCAQAQAQREYRRRQRD
jgi:hypothetical protein